MARPAGRAAGPDRAAIHRDAALILAVAIAMATAFVVSYALTLDRPVPRHIPTALVGDPADGSGLAERLDAGVDGALDYRPYPSTEAAYRAIRARRAAAALVLDPSGPRLLVAGAESPALARLLRDAASGVTSTGSGDLVVTDVLPLPDSDRSGLGGFYAMVAATLLGFLTTLQLRINDPQLGAGSSLVAIAVLAAAGGFVLAVTVGPVIGALPAPLAAVWVVLSAQIAVAALFGTLMSRLFGRWAVVPTWLLFIALGNAASGGPVSAFLLPQPYATISRVHPDGVTVDLLRTAAYFPDAGALRPAMVEAGWLLGLLGLVLVMVRRARPGPADR